MDIMCVCMKTSSSIRYTCGGTLMHRCVCM